jgi:uncharacterized protein (DUF927 family)
MLTLPSFRVQTGNYAKTVLPGDMYTVVEIWWWQSAGFQMRDS